MIPPHYWKDTITVFRKVRTVTNGKTAVTWTKSIYSNCFASMSDRQRMGDTELKKTPSLIVRVPSAVGDLQKDDVVYIGEFSGSTPVFNSEPKAFILNTVIDNRRLRTSHYRGEADNYGI